ncbi:hypothetical protein FB451DRAFT_1561899 [Mycena latifolia]|nr:hypothetical protein FB451DRAFT_1561899 [Mycena latifolia]
MDFGIRGHLQRMDDAYLQPAQRFLKESFQEHSLMTSMLAVFAVASFVPIVSAVALALFTFILAAAGFLVTLAALGLLLSIALSITFVLAVIITGAVWAIKSLTTKTNDPVAEPTTTNPAGPTVADYHIYLQRGYAVLKSIRRRTPGWKSSLLAFALFRNLFARIFLPRVVRYHPFYPYVFGSDRTPHPLKWVLVDAIHFIQVSLVSTALPLCVLLALSPSIRSAAGKRIEELWTSPEPAGTARAPTDAPRAPVDSDIRSSIQRGRSVLNRIISATPGWKASLLGFALFRNLFARIFLPRVVRHHPFYPYIFGSDRTPHPLRWVWVDTIDSIIEFVMPFAAAALLTACGLLILSPSVRSAARKKIQEFWPSSAPTEAEPRSTDAHSFIPRVRAVLSRIPRATPGWKSILLAFVLTRNFIGLGWPFRLVAALGSAVMTSEVLTAGVLFVLLSSMRSVAEGKSAAPSAVEVPVDAAARQPPHSPETPTEPAQEHEMESPAIAADGATTTAVSTSAGNSGEGVRPRNVHVAA